jgi:hypothetical protein
MEDDGAMKGARALLSQLKIWLSLKHSDEEEEASYPHQSPSANS